MSWLGGSLTWKSVWLECIKSWLQSPPPHKTHCASNLSIYRRRQKHPKVNGILGNIELKQTWGPWDLVSAICIAGCGEASWSIRCYEMLSIHYLIEVTWKAVNYMSSIFWCARKTRLWGPQIVQWLSEQEEKVNRRSTEDFKAAKWFSIIL